MHRLRNCWIEPVQGYKASHTTVNMTNWCQSLLRIPDLTLREPKRDIDSVNLILELEDVPFCTTQDSYVRELFTLDKKLLIRCNYSPECHYIQKKPWGNLTRTILLVLLWVFKVKWNLPLPKFWKNGNS